MRGHEPKQRQNKKKGEDQFVPATSFSASSLPLTSSLPLSASNSHQSYNHLPHPSLPLNYILSSISRPLLFCYLQPVSLIFNV